MLKDRDFSLHRSKLLSRKVKSEKVRGSRTRSRLRPQVSSDADDLESEMVEMPPTPRKHGTGFLSGDAPFITCEDESENAIFGARSPSLPDILNVGVKASKLTSDGVSVPHPEGEGGAGPRVTFRTPSESDNESVTSQKSTLTQQQPQQQQNLDFQLDVAVDIDSGKCVFYPADDGEKDETTEAK